MIPGGLDWIAVAGVTFLSACLGFLLGWALGRRPRSSAPPRCESLLDGHRCIGGAQHAGPHYTQAPYALRGLVQILETCRSYGLEVTGGPADLEDKRPRWPVDWLALPVYPWQDGDRCVLLGGIPTPEHQGFPVPKGPVVGRLYVDDPDAGVGQMLLVRVGDTSIPARVVVPWELPVGARVQRVLEPRTMGTVTGGRREGGDGWQPVEWDEGKEPQQDGSLEQRWCPEKGACEVLPFAYPWRARTGKWSSWRTRASRPPERP